MIWFMTTVHVRANQTTVDWAEGAEFVCERTPFVDNLIQHGGLTELDAVPEFSIDQFRTDPSQPYVTYRDSVPEGNVVDAQDKVAAVNADVDFSSEERQDAEKALANAQADAAAAQEDLNQARADSAETLTELNTELDTDQSRKSEIGAGIEDSVVSVEMEKRGDDGDDGSVGRASGPELDKESEVPKPPRTRRKSS